MATDVTVRNNGTQDLIYSLSKDCLAALSYNVAMANKNGGPNNLRAWREHRRMSQEELAEKIGTTAGMISHLETGERGLSAKWLRRLAAALNTTPGHVLDLDLRNMDAEVFDFWDRASQAQRRTIVEVTRAIVRDGTAA
jgi:transcriptional regulator with XRE-family HTH domain